MTSAYRWWREDARSRVRFGRLALPILLVLLGVSCGDVYRPVALPIPGTSPAPAPAGHILAIATNGTVTSPPNQFLNFGSLSRIDVPGDSVVQVAPTGIAPVHGALTTAGRLYVANSGDDTVFASPLSASTPGTTINLVQLCDNLGCPPITPVFVHSTEASRMYVANSGNGSISVIDTSLNIVVNTFAVSPVNTGNPLPSPDRLSQPIALAELPNGRRIYSANKGTNSVSSINTQDGTINQVISLPAAPVWIVANVDNTHVYVLDSADTISVIDATTDTIVSSVSAGTAGGNLNHLVYEPVMNRVYATDANSPQPALALFDVASQGNLPNSTLVPHGPGKAPITPALGSTCTSAPVPTSVTVVGDGSRAYVASYQDDGTQICTQATVVDTGTGLVTKTIPLSQTALSPGVLSQTNCDLARFRVYAASSLGGTNSNFKVYVSQCDAGSVGIIDAFALGTGPNPHPADWFAGWVPSPVSSFSSSQVTITAISAPQVQSCPATTPAAVTYTYSLLSGPTLQPGMTVYVTGMKNSANDGAFPITSATSSTFTVNNTCPAVDSSAQSGNGSVIPPQNPVFLVPGT
jgi:DNA-binding beta-propeller fold protein YncE